MSIATRILRWLSHAVRVPKEDVVKIVERMDTDSDGYIDMSEVYAELHSLVDLVRRGRWHRHAHPSG